MLAEIRSQARSAETDALAAALTSACLQVPVDVASLRANLQRARGVLEREEADDAAKAAAANVRLVPEDAPVNQKPPGGALINMVYTDGVAASLDVGYSIDDDEPERMDPLEVIEIESVTGDGAETDGESEATPAAAAGSPGNHGGHRQVRREDVRGERHGSEWPRGVARGGDGR